jgi:hypothetical protein
MVNEEEEEIHNKGHLELEKERYLHLTEIYKVWGLGRIKSFVYMEIPQLVFDYWKLELPCFLQIYRIGIKVYFVPHNYKIENSESEIHLIKVPKNRISHVTLKIVDLFYAYWQSELDFYIEDDKIVAINEHLRWNLEMKFVDTSESSLLQFYKEEQDEFYLQKLIAENKGRKVLKPLEPMELRSQREYHKQLWDYSKAHPFRDPKVPIIYNPYKVIHVRKWKSLKLPVFILNSLPTDTSKIRVIATDPINYIFPYDDYDETLVGESLLFYIFDDLTIKMSPGHTRILSRDKYKATFIFFLKDGIPCFIELNNYEEMYMKDHGLPNE